jgi:hypothetical protein
MLNEIKAVAKKGRFSFSFEYTVYATLFICSYFFMIVNNGIYWDTWTVYNTPFDVIANSSMQGGNPFSGYSVYFAINWLSPFKSRLLVCIFYFLAGVFLNEILKKIRLFKTFDRIIIVSLFLIVPVNFARVCVIMFPYALGYLSFFIGIFLFLLFLNTHGLKKMMYRVLSLGLLYFSFIMLNSLLVFFWILPVALLISIRLREAVFQGKSSNMLNYLDFLALPFVNYAVKTMFFTPYASYQGYNLVSYSGLIDAFKAMPVEVSHMFSGFFHADLLHADLQVLLVMFLIIFVGLSAVLFYCNRGDEDELPKGELQHSLASIILFIIISLLCLVLAVLPYLVVGKPIGFSDWWSRNQILMPLGLSLLFYLLIRMVRTFLGHTISILCLAGLVSCFIVKNNMIYFQYLVDNIKQQCLIKEFQSNKVIKDGTSFLVREATFGLNAGGEGGRVYRFYEYSGLMRKAFGDQKRLAVDTIFFSGDMAAFKDAEINSRMNIEGHPLNEPDTLITISYQSNYSQTLSQLLWAYILRDSIVFEKLKLELLDVQTRAI